MKDCSFLTSNIIAHRGYHNINKNIPENSIAAFKKAIRCKYIIELDVHLTKDKRIVVFHDDNLKRMCNVDKKIEDCTYKELLKYNLNGTKYKIPLFEEVLSLVSGSVPLLIETKVSKFNGVLEKNLSRLLDNYEGLFAVQSFNPLSINWFRKHRKNFIRGILSYDFKNYKMPTLTKIILRTLFLDIILKTDFISYEISCMPNYFTDKKRKNKILLGWTVRNKKDYLKIKDYCDNLICENMEEYL